MLTLGEFKSQLTRQGTAKWSTNPSLESFWCFEMKAPNDQIWEYLADTSRFNRALGFSARDQVEKDGRIVVSTRMMGLRQEWVELPWAWLVGRTIAFGRDYTRGMAKHVDVVFHIENDTENDRRFVYVYFGWTPANWFWTGFLRATDLVLKKKFGENFAKIDEHLADVSKRSYKALCKVPPALNASALQTIDSIGQKLIDRKQNSEAVKHLVEFVKSGDDFDLESIRVVSLARKWKLDQVELLKTCLHGTRLGLLKISWDVICPHCRGSRFSAGSLGDIPETANCAVCEIEFSTANENSIEVIFHVHESIRTVERQMYCAAEPAKKSHIKIQQTVEPGQILRIKTKFPQGIYRARAIGDVGESRVEISERSAQRVYDHSRRSEIDQLNSECEIIYKNDGQRSVGFVFEEVWWERNALRPAQVLSLPDFRDLFSHEHLSSAVKLYVGEQTILFTDIVGSTNFYANVGDAKAFSEVRSHFQEIYQSVVAFHGVVVKTIGDAVMAAFPSISQAVAAGIEIQQKFSHDRNDTSIRLRISIHAGPVIAVKLNTGLDYFGNTVNIAAKIQSCAGAGEVALSEAAFRSLQSDVEKLFPVVIRHSKRDGAEITDVHVLNVSGLSKSVA